MKRESGAPRPEFKKEYLGTWRILTANQYLDDIVQARTVSPYAVSDAEISKRLLEKQLLLNSQPVTSARTSSTGPNQSNRPKSVGMFAGETYPKRKSCRSPKEGDMSVSEGEKYLYKYIDNEWNVVGAHGRLTAYPIKVSNYFSK